MSDSAFAPMMLASIPDEAVALLAVGGAFVVAIIWIVAATADSMMKTRAREASRREIAAYVAEGSMTPEEGARLLEAGRKPKSRHA